MSHSKWFILEGIIFILLGIAAIAVPAVMTLTINMLIGWLFLLGGLVKGIRTFQAWGAPGFWPSVLSSILYVVAGSLFLLYPLTGILTLTILLASFFLVEGIAEIAFGYELSGWFIFSGLINLVLGAIIWSGWPGTAVWTIGLLVGVNLLMYGFSLLAYHKQIPFKP